MNKKIRILVADDEPTSRLLMQAALENAGFEVELAVKTRQHGLGEL